MSPLRFIALLLFFPVSVFASEVSVKDFARFPQFQQIVISPTGEYVAASLQKEDGEPLVAFLNIDNLSFISSLEFKQSEVPGILTWLNDERVGLPLYYTNGTLDFPVTYGDYFATNINGKNRRKIWGVLNESGLKINPSISVMKILNLMSEDPRTVLVEEQNYENGKRIFSKAYELDVYSGRKKKLATAPIKGADLLADHNQQVRIAIGITADKSENTLKVFHRKSNDENWSILNQFSTGDGELIPIAFDKNNQTIYALSNTDTVTKAVVKLDLDSPNNPTVLYRNELVDVNFDDINISHDGQLASISVSPDFTYNKNPAEHPIGNWLKKLQKIFPQNTVSITSGSRDNARFIVKVSSASNPGDFYLLDTKSGKVRFLTKSSPWIDSKKMAEVKPIKLAVRDGMEIFGYITTPKDKTKNLPLVVLPHGGPHGVRDYWEYNPDVQLLANNGYAVLQVNFRGSDGYGREFSVAGYGQWGAKMQDDVTDATLWAIEQGIADPKKICIYGGSYGAYSALMGAVRNPDLYQCAVGYAGVYDLPQMFEEGDISDSKKGLNYLKAVLGNDVEKLKTRSPVHNIDKLKASLLLVHGGKDERTPITQLESLTKALDEADYPYETLIKPNEGHGFYQLDNREDFYNKLLKFLDKNIGH